MNTYTRRAFVATTGAFALGGCAQSRPQQTNVRAIERKVLWAANVRTISLADRLVAAQIGSFADRAKALGLRVTLEFMPISSIQDLSAGWAIVQGANRSNAGLCFDTWHYFRSKPDDALLQSIPGERVFEVQLADALIALQGKDLTDDLLRFRRLPGQGEMPIAQLVPVLKRIGAWRSVGPEVFADAMDALSATEVGRQTKESLVRWL
jgi:sugar phosphate isomerase/epimerase